MSKKSSILFRCTEDQKAVYESKAIEHGLNLSQLVIAALDAYEGGKVSVEPIAVIKTSSQATEAIKALPAPKIQQRVATEEQLGLMGLKKGAVEGTDYWWKGNKIVRATPRS